MAARELTLRKTARSFCAAGLHAPKVYAVADDQMSYLQEDLGDGQLFALLKPSIEKGSFSEEELGWLHRTLELLPAVQFEVGKGFDWSICFPDRELNDRMVSFDLNYFKYDFLKFTGIDFNEIRLQDDFDRIREDAVNYSGDTFLYRDFQARNVMIKDGEPCFIDFQGGRRGHAGLRRELELTYLKALEKYRPVDEGQFYKEYRLMTLLRLLQETAAYGFRGLVERKQIFLDCIPTVLGCLRELTAEPFPRYPYVTEVLRRVANEWDGSTNMPGMKVEL